MSQLSSEKITRRQLKMIVSQNMVAEVEIICQQSIPTLDVKYHLCVAQEHNVKVEVSPTTTSVPILAKYGSRLNQFLLKNLALNRSCGTTALTALILGRHLLVAMLVIVELFSVGEEQLLRCLMITDRVISRLVLLSLLLLSLIFNR